MKYNKVCAICDKNFGSDFKNQKYCTKDCLKVAKIEQKKKAFEKYKQIHNIKSQAEIKHEQEIAFLRSFGIEGNIISFPGGASQ